MAMYFEIIDIMTTENTYNNLATLEISLACSVCSTCGIELQPKDM